MNQVEQIWLLRRNGHPDEAQDCYRKLCEKSGVRGDTQTLRVKFELFSNSLVETSRKPKEDARDLLVFESAAFLREGHVERSRKLLTEIEKLSRDFNILNTFDFSFQLGLQAGVEGDFASGLYNFKLAMNLSPLYGWQWILVAPNVLFMQEYLSSDNEQDAQVLYDLVLKHPEFPSYSETKGQLDAYRLRKTFARGRSEELKGLGEISGIQSKYLVLLLVELPYQLISHDQELMALSKKVKSSFLNDNTAYQFRYRTETLFESMAPSKKTMHSRTGEVVDRLYLWLWRWMAEPNMKRLRDVLALYRTFDDRDLGRVDATSRLMFQNFTQWLSLLNVAPNDSTQLFTSEKISEESSDALFHQESRLIQDLSEYHQANLTTGITSLTTRSQPCFKDFLKKGELRWPYFQALLKNAENQSAFESNFSALIQSFFDKPRTDFEVCLDYRNSSVWLTQERSSVHDSYLCAFFSCFVTFRKVGVEDLMSIVFSTKNYALETNYRRLSKLIFRANQLLNGQGTFSRSNNYVKFEVSQDESRSRAKGLFFEIGGPWAKQLFYATHVREACDSFSLEKESRNSVDPVYVKRAEIQESLGDYSKAHVLRMISSLSQRGILSPFGQGKNACYKVIDQSQLSSYCQAHHKSLARQNSSFTKDA